MSLRMKMARGAIWSSIGNIGAQFISFVVFMFVARIIGPKEYGLVNLCFVTSSLVSVVIEGLADGIVSLQIRDDRRLSTLFWCVLGIGGGLTLAGVIGAGRVAVLLNEPKLQPLLQWYSLVFVCLAVQVVPGKLIYAALDFRSYALRTMIAGLISGVVALVLAYRGFGAYAIVAQQIVFLSLVNCIMWLHVKWRPSFSFDVTAIKECLLPGMKAISNEMVNFAENQVPRIFVGKISGPVTLGYYAFVTRIRYAIQDVLINPSLGVLYPALAQVKGDFSEQRAVLDLVLAFMGFAVYPVLALGAYLAPLYVPLLFGSAWEPAVPILQVFICGSVALPVMITIRETMRAHNKMGAYVKSQAPLVGVGLVIAFVLLPHGVLLASVGIVGWVFCRIPLCLALLNRWVGINLWPSVLRLARPLSITAIMIAALQLAAQLDMLPSNRWLRLLSSIALGGSVYLSVCSLIQHREIMKMISFARGSVAAGRNKAKAVPVEEGRQCNVAKQSSNVP